MERLESAGSLSEQGDIRFLISTDDFIQIFRSTVRIIHMALVEADIHLLEFKNLRKVFIQRQKTLLIDRWIEIVVFTAF